MTFGFSVLTFAGLSLLWSLNAAGAANSCHIHPLGTDMKDAEACESEWYGSLEECETAKKNFLADWVCAIVFRTTRLTVAARIGALGRKSLMHRKSRRPTDEAVQSRTVL